MPEIFDEIGLKTLETFEKASQFNRWMFDDISSYCEGSVLEIGSGIGNLSVWLLRKENSVTLSDVQGEYCRRLERRFQGKANLKGIYKIDLEDPQLETLYPDLLGSFDTIVALNVVEHIQNDALAINNCNKLLKNGGKLIILVPAFQALYNGIDRDLGHYRRYSSKSLRALLSGSGMNVMRKWYFNAAAIAGWFLSGTLLRRNIIAASQVKLYNRLVPVFRLFDLVTHKLFGLSIIAIAQKKGIKQ